MSNEGMPIGGVRMRPRVFRCVRGHEFSEADLAELDELFGPLWENYIADWEAKGVPMKEAIDLVWNTMKDEGIEVFPAATWSGDKGQIGKVLSRLGGGPVYVTLDLDVLDPAFMPATGTPEPGGLNWWNVVNLLKAVSAEKEIVGFDVVELIPMSGTIAPDFLAAKLVYKLIGFICCGPAGPAR